MALPTKLTLNIVSPDQSISQEVDEVSLPGSEGDFGVLPGHTPFFTSLRTGAGKDPLIVINGEQDSSLSPSHLATLGFHLLRARTQLRELVDTLQK